jgi:small-conductance mechanosensitive channel
MLLNDLIKWFNTHQITITRLVIILILSLAILAVINIFLRKWLKSKVSPQSQLLITKLINYGAFVIIFLTVLREFNIRFTALLGAAGVAGIAIGFAAQTSLSNIISGIFLLWEKPFQVGDLLKVEDKMGIVHSMDLLSVNLRTFDNLTIRIPNEKLIKATFTNVTRFPIRRLDLNLGIAYKNDLEKAFTILRQIADKNPLCLDEPEPLIVVKGFGDSAQEILFGVWFEKNDYGILRNSILKEIKLRFDKEGIEIPFPHRSLYTGSVTEPFPVKILSTEK